MSIIITKIEEFKYELIYFLFIFITTSQQPVHRTGYIVYIVQNWNSFV
jgi:hypothetical protein